MEGHVDGFKSIAYILALLNDRLYPSEARRSMAFLNANPFAFPPGDPDPPANMSTCDKCHSPLPPQGPPPSYQPEGCGQTNEQDASTASSTLEGQPDVEKKKTNDDPPPAVTLQAGLLMCALIGAGIWAVIQHVKREDAKAELERQTERVRLHQAFAEPVFVTVTEWYEALPTATGLGG